jgi:polyisoprenoid-binding protein YceI
MARWEFEPGHTAAGFKARHMMVTWVLDRGGVVVSDEVFVTIDVEAILEEDLTQA